MSDKVFERSDMSDEERAAWVARIKTVQTVELPHVVYKSETGSTQTYHHSSGGKSARVDANVVVPTAKGATRVNQEAGK